MDPVLEKYAHALVPRYTSYPTAPHFNGSVGSERYRHWLAELDPSVPISLYLHVPFCRLMCWYCGCNMKLASRYGPLSNYLFVLLKEIDLIADALPAKMRVTHLHWGGGTPTSLEPDDLERAMARVHKRFEIEAGAELAIESDPRTLTDEMIERIGALGFNRASFGVQEFDPKVQEAINRVQPPEMVRWAVEALREVGVGGGNFDLIYGLPYQSADSLAGTIDLCAEMRPDRVALFGYAHVPWMAKNQRMIPEEALPDGRARFEQASRAAEAWREVGYHEIGLDHFAHPDDPLARAAADGTLRRNFQGYTTDVADTLIGIGATSIGRTPSGYVQNIHETGAWSRAVEAGELPISKGLAFRGDDLARATIIEQLMCNLRVDLAKITRDFDQPNGHFASDLARLAPMVEDGFLSIDGDILQIEERGRPLIRCVAAAFDAYLESSKARHSRAV